MLLLRRNHELFALVKNDLQSQEFPFVKCIQQDLSQSFHVESFPKSLDAIIHLAQSRFYKNFPEQASDIFAINLHGTFNLLEYGRAAGIKHFIFASTGGVYGSKRDKCAETDPVSLPDFYVASKYAAELLVAKYQPFYRTVIFRFFFVYGPGQNGRLVPDLMRRTQTDEPIRIDGEDGLRMNPIYVDDAIRAFPPALKLETSEIFNIAGEETVSLKELIRALEQVMGKKAKIEMTDRPLQGGLMGDNTRMKTILKITPEITLVKGLQETVRSTAMPSG